MEKKEVFVTETVLPERELFMEYVGNIFDSHTLTNQGAMLTQLEKELKEYLDVPYLNLCNNGTLALQLGIRLYGWNGKKIITTPFTYVATASALLWEGASPVFADIDSETLCLDPARVEEILRRDSSIAGILPVHVYGNACDVEAFERLSQKYGMPVFYDGAHAFGSFYRGHSLLSFGNASICSFHATKIFHTVEGGCLIMHTQKEDSEAKLLRAFGHIGDEHISLGINAKLSELHAAMGLALLPVLPEILRKRAENCKLYDKLLDIQENPALRSVRLRKGLEWNHAYYPIIFKTSELCDAALEALRKCRINPRRYFYPSLTKLPYVKGQSCPIAEDICGRVLCLPLWPDMGHDLIGRIAEIILKSLA